MLVIGHQTALEVVVPTLAGVAHLDWEDEHELDNTACVELARTGDGWVLVRS